MVLSMKSMKTVTSSNSHHLPSLRAGGAALIAFGAYIALNVEQCDYGLCSAGIQLQHVETVPLAACPVLRKGAKKGGNKGGEKALDDLVMDHNQLGFAASELIENVARPLERTWSEHRANITMNSCDFPSFRASVLNTPTILDAAMYAVNTTATLASCVSNTFTNSLKKSSASFNQRYAMKDVFQKSHLKTGAARFATNDAVEKIRSIFSHCPEVVSAETKLSSKVGSKYAPEVSYVRSVGGGQAKKIFNTVVADGWGVEARLVNGLWTDVLVSRGEFQLRLKRDKVGLIWAVVDGVVVGEV